MNVFSFGLELYVFCFFFYFVDFDGNERVGVNGVFGFLFERLLLCFFCFVEYCSCVLDFMVGGNRVLFCFVVVFDIWWFCLLIFIMLFVDENVFFNFFLWDLFNVELFESCFVSWLCLLCFIFLVCLSEEKSFGSVFFFFYKI